MELLIWPCLCICLPLIKLNVIWLQVECFFCMALDYTSDGGLCWIDYIIVEVRVIIQFLSLTCAV